MDTVRNRPITPVEVESELLRLTSEIEYETEAFEVLAKDHAQKEAAYKKQWFKEYLAAEGAVKQKESWAGYKTSELYYDEWWPKHSLRLNEKSCIHYVLLVILYARLRQTLDHRLSSEDERHSS